jgi:hypothetical protein
MHLVWIKIMKEIRQNPKVKEKETGETQWAVF